MNLSPGSPDGAMGTLKGASSTTGDDDGVDRSEVIRRHLSAGAGTPLYT